jgi:hypothetical protein
MLPFRPTVHKSGAQNKERADVKPETPFFHNCYDFDTTHTFSRRNAPLPRG